MINLRALTPFDARIACKNAKSVYGSERDILGRVLSNMERGPSFTLYDEDGEIGCIVGGTRLWEGMARVWAITTPYLDKHPVGYTRTVLALLNWGVGYYNIHRLEMTVKADYLAGIKWAKLFGFEAEGLLRQYGADKSDYLLFGRLS